LSSVRSPLADLLDARPVLLADGATGTNYFQMGLESGEPPELWNIDQPGRVAALHTNTFGGTRNRLALHRAEHRVFELAKAAATIARQVADAAGRPVVVAGSVGPTGELFEPLGALTHATATAAFREQVEGLVAGGVDVVWIETMSAPEEVRAAATAASEVGVPYTATCSFDTAGRTMMGLSPADLGRVFDGVASPPLAYGANCGVGAPDILVSLLEMTAADPAAVTICKGNCGMPRFEGTQIVYSGTPALMGHYAALAIDAGARIIGGCCGTTPEHLAAMRRAIDQHPRGDRPDQAKIVADVGPLTNAAPTRTRREARPSGGRRSP
jgi:5-methyltetrahydrofolate--homocysteine methyltransferase